MSFADDFVDKLQGLKFKDAFNPYCDTDQTHDIDDAPAIRSRTLMTVVDKGMQSEVEAIWVGLAPGHLGARRTGLALTDDANRETYLERWGVEADCPTRSAAPQREPTASRVWSELSRIDETIFLWNVFPLHPHEPDKPFTNRNLRPEERRAGKRLLAELIAGLQPGRLIAVGREAEAAALDLAPGLEVHYVPHPSRRKTAFLTSVRELYP